MGFNSFFAELHFARGTDKHTSGGLPSIRQRALQVYDSRAAVCLLCTENYSSASVEAV